MLREKPALRVASSISNVNISYLVYIDSLKHYAGDKEELLDYNTFRKLPFDQWHRHTVDVVTELCVVRLQVVDDQEIVHVASTEDAPADNDDINRIKIIDDLLSSANRPVSKLCSDKKEMQRIDAPQIEDSFEKAIPEDTPGYIACAFPTLFPFGTGDYHAARGAARVKFDFATWGKHVLQYHDQRFMRHTRFRYFFMNTWLRIKSLVSEMSFGKYIQN